MGDEMRLISKIRDRDKQARRPPPWTQRAQRKEEAVEWQWARWSWNLNPLSYKPRVRRLAVSIDGVERGRGRVHQKHQERPKPSKEVHAGCVIQLRTCRDMIEVLPS
jgi:hypothetical protein